MIVHCLSEGAHDIQTMRFANAFTLILGLRWFTDFPSPNEVSSGSIKWFAQPISYFTISTFLEFFIQSTNYFLNSMLAYILFNESIIVAYFSTDKPYSRVQFQNALLKFQRGCGTEVMSVIWIKMSKRTGRCSDNTFLQVTRYSKSLVTMKTLSTELSHAKQAVCLLISFTDCGISWNWCTGLRLCILYNVGQWMTAASILFSNNIFEFYSAFNLLLLSMFYWQIRIEGPRRFVLFLKYSIVLLNI